MTDPTRPSEAQAIIDTVKALHEPKRVDCHSPDGRANADVACVPNGMSLVSIKKFVDEWRDKPERREGTVPLFELGAFVEYVNRFKDGDSLIFADNDREKPKLAAVIDYHRAGFTGDPAWGKHRVHYSFPLSDEWKVWHGQSGVKMSQGDFAEFLEDHISDVIAPPLASDGMPGGDALLDQLLITLGGAPASPSKLMELSRGLSVTSNDKVANAVNLQSGEMAVTYQSTHTDGAGSKVAVPPLFLIAIPVFRNGPPYKIAARLRYRVGGGGIVWFFQLYRTDKVFDHAFDEAVTFVRQNTGAVTLLGRPE